MTNIEKFDNKVYCRKCKNKTNHDIITKHSISGDDEEYGYYWTEDYIIGQCRGCDTITFIKQFDDSTMHFYVPEEGWIHQEDIVVYPPEPLTNDKKDSYNKVEFQHLPELLDTLYHQVVANFELKYYLLAAAGLRMIIEGICNDLSIKDGYVTDDESGEIVYKDGNQVRSGNLTGKINGLVEEGILTVGQTTILHIIRKLGNQTVHKLNNPKRRILLQGLEVIEHTLKSIYELKKYETMAKHLKS